MYPFHFVHSHSEEDILSVAGPVESGVAITGAGNLRCNHIIHLGAPSGLAQWREMIHHALKEADSISIESVAFPALGTGNNRN